MGSLQLVDPFIGIPLSNKTLDIGTLDEGTYYNDHEDNMLAVDGNKSVLRYKMLRGEAVNIIYALGLVEYTDTNNAEHMAVVGSIAVTYNSTSSAVTETEIYTHHYTEN